MEGTTTAVPAKRRVHRYTQEELDIMLARIDRHLAVAQRKKDAIVKQKEQQSTAVEDDGIDRQGRQQLLRENLLRLTEAVALSYDNDMYGSQAPPITRLYMGYEDAVLQDEVKKLRTLGKLDLALDLGCATGRTALRLCRDFWKVEGCDISPAMIRVAKDNIAKDPAMAKKAGEYLLDIQEADIEAVDSFPYPPNYASLIVMNLGTASDIMNLKLVLHRIYTTLQHKGRFVLSFYNASALFYHWFLPWPLGLVAEINQFSHCLDVHVGEKVFQVYARPYTLREVKNSVAESGLEISEITTYPTMAAVIPEDLLGDEKVAGSVAKIDQSLKGLGEGAYIVVTGGKPALPPEEEVITLPCVKPESLDNREGV